MFGCGLALSIYIHQITKHGYRLIIGDIARIGLSLGNHLVTPFLLQNINRTEIFITKREYEIGML